MIHLEIKPLSVNKAWQGKRYKTPEYKRFERYILIMLPKFIVPEGKLKIQITYGFSNSRSDIDNPTKPILDILQKKYRFNDNQIYELNLKKEIVYKGSEFIDIEIEKAN